MSVSCTDLWNRIGGVSLSHLSRRTEFSLTLVLALMLAVVWWLVALRFEAATGVPVWRDQDTTFTQALHHLADPYPALAFPYVPWTAVLLVPAGLLPLRWSVLAQMALYFAILTAVVFKFGGGLKAVLLTLTSAIAFDTALEINMEWLVCLGLLVPPAWSGPLLLVKPQVALGYGLSFRGRDVLRAGGVVLVVVLVALILWPGWPGKMLADIQTNTLGDWGSRINIAPSRLMPAPLAWLMGLLLSWRAFRRKDPILGVLAWLFFVPYATLYSLMPAFALFAIRWPRVALVISGTLWLLYGGVLLSFLQGG